MEQVAKKKRRYTDKRRQMSREAARCRRTNEATIFSELLSVLPASCVSQPLDKASIVRIAISYLKLQQFLSDDWRDSNRPVSLTALDCKFDHVYLKALDGFVMIINKKGEIMFITENVTSFLGLTQVDIVGHSIFEMIHPCDQDDVQNILIEKRHDHSIASLMDADSRTFSRDFVIRMKSNVHNKNGHSSSSKTGAGHFRVLRCCAHKLSNADNNSIASCVVLTCRLISNPLVDALYIDKQTFISHHDLDMKFTYCDRHVQNMLKYKPNQLVGKSAYHFHHACDGEMLERAFKILLAKGQVVTGPYRFLACGGGFVWVETHATIVSKPLSPSDKLQTVFCVNNVISGIEEPNMLLSDVQLESLTVRAEFTAYDQLTFDPVLNGDAQDCMDDSECSDDECNTSGTYEDQIKTEPDAAGVSARMQFSTEMIIESCSHNKAEHSVGKAIVPERFSVSATANSDATKDSEQNCQFGTIPSNNSLHHLLERLEHNDVEERAPWISMDDMTFGDDDGTVCTSIADTETTQLGGSSGCVVFTSGNEHELQGFSIETACKGDKLIQLPLISSTVKGMESALYTSNNDSDDVGDRGCESILKNLLVAGKDYNFGYQLSFVPNYVGQ